MQIEPVKAGYLGTRRLAPAFLLVEDGRLAPVSLLRRRAGRRRRGGGFRGLRATRLGGTQHGTRCGTHPSGIAVQPIDLEASGNHGAG